MVGVWLYKPVNHMKEAYTLSFHPHEFSSTISIVSNSWLPIPCYSLFKKFMNLNSLRKKTHTSKYRGRPEKGDATLFQLPRANLSNTLIERLRGKK